jgi:hypothetical protein
MIRFISCIKRRDDISLEEFRRHWESGTFGEIQGRMAAALGASRYARSVTLVVEANRLILEERGLAEPFDGIIEYWWDSARDVMRLAESPEGQSARNAMLEFQRQFVDFTQSRAFFTDA